MNAAEFCLTFEDTFGERAAGAGLVRARRKPLRWRLSCADGTQLWLGFRFNRKNLAGFPGEFMPDVFWTGVRHNERDTGEVSFYQYTSPAERNMVESLRRSIVDGFVAEMRLEDERNRAGSLAAALAVACDTPILPHHNVWLPYWKVDDASAWGVLFGGIIGAWVSRFSAQPETLEAYCWRVVWKDEARRR